jgi:hypothetical protein
VVAADLIWHGYAVGAGVLEFDLVFGAVGAGYNIKIRVESTGGQYYKQVEGVFAKASYEPSSALNPH